MQTGRYTLPEVEVYQMFRIELLPALHGDSVLIQYGPSETPRRILIDGGPIGAYKALAARLDELPLGRRRFELLTITHIDADHIEGAVRLLAERTKDFYFDDVWFNGWRHLDDSKGILGAVSGEFLSALIATKVGTERWNNAEPFRKGTIKAGSEDLPTVNLAGGMKLTVLSPTDEKLHLLRKTWEKDVKKTGFDPGDLDAALALLRETKRLVPKGLLGGSYQEAGERFRMDSAVANGSSIALLAEFEGKRCLLLADAHPDVVAASLRKLLTAGDKKLRVDAVKLSHHGSSANTTPELLDLIDCRRFLVSTNGDVFGHPDAPAIDMILRRAGPDVTLFFNYTSKTTQAWADAARQREERFTSVYPRAEGESLILDL
jgi:beta-lactamase superfamily II metal-dependent hydrolase